MIALSKNEFAECIQVSSDIIAFLKKSQWNWTTTPNFAANVLKSQRLSGVTITLGAVKGHYTKINLIKADSSIRINIPNQGFLPSRFSSIQECDIRRVISGVVSHECTHVIQEQHFPATYAANADRGKLFCKIYNPSHDDWFDFYVGQPLELEARANQAVAEVIEIAGHKIGKPDFELKLKQTEILQRTERQIGSICSQDRKVRFWWENWSVMVWDIYNQ
jgi:hypothetical protein